MSATTATEITFDRDDVIEMSVEIDAATDYLYDLLRIGDHAHEWEPQVYKHLFALRQQLRIAVGLMTEGGDETDEVAIEELEMQAFDRGREWLAADAERIAAAIARRVTDALEVSL